MQTSCNGNLRFWDFPDEVLSQLVFLVKTEEACVMSAFDNSDEYLSSENHVFIRANAGVLQAKGDRWRTLCDWWMQKDANVYKGLPVVQQLRKNQLRMCSTCERRIVSHILGSAIEWMVGMGRWMPKTERGLFHLGENVTRPFEQVWQDDFS